MYACYLIHYRGFELPSFYIGSTSIKNIETGYRGSITSKKYKNIFKSELKKHPDLFEIFIISTHNNRNDATIAELSLQKELDVVKSKDFFNESFASVDGMYGRDVSGINNPMYGRKQSQLTKDKIAKKRKGVKCKPFSDEHKQKIGLGHKGKVTVKDNNGKIFKVMLNDPRYISGELVHFRKSLIKKEIIGKRGSDELKNHLSKIAKGKPKSDQMKLNLSKSYLIKNIYLFPKNLSIYLAQKALTIQ